MKRILALFGATVFAMLFLAGSAAAQGPSIKVVGEAKPASVPAGGGDVTYIYTVTNKGSSPLEDIEVSDDECSIVDFVSGDINQDDKLDVTESWRYECETFITEKTVNSVVARGYLNEQASTDITSTTVTVGDSPASVSPAIPSAIPSKVPKTGGGGAGLLTDFVKSVTTATGLLGAASIAFYLRYRRR